MTRNYVVLFTFILIITTSLLVSLTGPKGFLVNRRMQVHVENGERLLEQRQLEQKDLEQRLNDIWSKDSLLDAARTLGYVRPGDTVRYFFDADGKVPRQSVNHTHMLEPLDAVRMDGVQGIPFPINLAIGGALSATILVIVGSVRRRRRRIAKFPLNGVVRYAKHHHEE